MSGQIRSSEAPQAFPATQWSVVFAATHRNGPGSPEALEAICRAYWHPLYAYVRRSGHSPSDAQDLTQEFFSRMLQKDWLNDADRGKGRLRNFLISALKHFLANEWRKGSAQRRGGGSPHVPLDTAFAESRFAADPATSPAEVVFDRHWALTLLDRTVDRLRAEFQASGKPDEFDSLKACLTAARGEIEYAAVARRLGLSEGAARVAVHRLRKRFRDVYREEIALTLADDADLDEELRHLAAALAGE